MEWRRFVTYLWNDPRTNSWDMQWSVYNSRPKSRKKFEVSEKNHSYQ